MQDERGNSKTVYFSGMMSWQTVVPCHETDEQEVSMRRKFSVSLERTFSHQVTVTSAGAVNVRMVGIQSRETGSGWE